MRKATRLRGGGGSHWRAPAKAGAQSRSSGWAPAFAGARSRQRERGFTLVELLVALLIFSMLAAAGVALLNFSVTAQAVAGERLDEMADVRRVSAVLGSDLAQAVPRLARNEAGDREPAFAGNDGGAALLFRFVRGGWSNLDAEPRAGLQKVEYVLADGRLERRAYPMLDGAPPGEPALLLDRVEALRVRYRGKEDWRERWDPVRPDDMPRAVELVIRRAGEPALRHVFLVGGAS